MSSETDKEHYYINNVPEWLSILFLKITPNYFYPHQKIILLEK